MAKMTGAEIFVESLVKENVELIFGYPGGAVLPIYDVLYDSKLKNYLTKHEQGAVHAADGYARSTGKVGVCISTSGPGATNLVTGLANAYMDSVPMVAFTGQVSTDFIGRDAFQEADIRGISMPITKHNYLVTNVDDLARTIKEAFYIARTGRPGPVLIDLPKDVTKEKTDFVYPDKVDLPGYNPRYKGHELQIKKAVKEINNAEKPVIFAGGGTIISGATEELRELAWKSNIPVITSLMALGAFPENDKLSLSMPGMHGSRYANYALSNTDLIITVGARFDDRVTGKLDTFAREAKIIHIDIDPAEISKNVSIDVPIVGDAREILSELVKFVEKNPRSKWMEQISNWKKSHPYKYEKDGTVIKPQTVVEKLYELTKGDAVVVTEVGQHQMWAAQYYNYTKPRTFLSSGGLGTMGYGFPASIGAQLANPSKTVLTIAGDGSFQMNLQELGTIANYDIPVKVVILNNSSLGMVRQWQEMFYDKRYSSTIIKNPDFVKLAEAFGVYGSRVENNDQLEDVLKEALEHDGPAVVDVKVAQEENVFPMVPAGASIKEMIGG
ncbi:MAG: biosynthetic-type acetolactate synthase large subunit [Halothermotrichaceae bacterium]